MVAEEETGFGDEKINYQEYVVPAFLTQVGHAELGGDVDEDVADALDAGDYIPHGR